MKPIVLALLALPALAQAPAPLPAPAIVCVLERSREWPGTSTLPFAELASRIESTLLQGGLRVVKETDVVGIHTRKLRISPELMTYADSTQVLVIQGSVEQANGQLLRAHWVGAYLDEARAKMECPDLAAQLAMDLVSKAETNLPHGSEIVPKVPESSGEVAVDFAKVKILLQPRMPPYPPKAKINRVQGRVISEIYTNVEGAPQKVVFKSGPPELAAHTLTYLLLWRFETPKQDGKSTPAHFPITMVYRLQ